MEQGFLDQASPLSAGVAVCIPVRNEADRITACLQAFARQDHLGAYDLVLLLNNCTDATAEVAAAFPAPPSMRIHILQRRFPGHLANAGHARRVAMRCARQLAGPAGILLCTDADAIVPPDWISSNLRHIGTGADAVAGCTRMDPQDLAGLPRRLHDDEAAAQLLTRLIDEIDSAADPVAIDPWPRHAEHSGASIAVTCAAYDIAGGIPDVPSSEDRAFFGALFRTDARIRHAPEIVVTVSGRLDGRAVGGMADTLRRRLTEPDLWLDECIEPAEDRLRRATMRHAARTFHAALASPAGDLGRLAAGGRRFGSFWQGLEARSPALRYRRVPAKDVDTEIAVAMDILRYRIDIKMTDPCNQGSAGQGPRGPWIPVLLAAGSASAS